MKAKEYLSQIRRLDTRIRIRKEELEALRTRAQGVAMRYESDGSSCATRDVHRQEKLYLDIIELEEEIAGKTEELIRKRQEILEKVEQLKDHNSMQVLYSRYFEFRKWEEIAVEMHYTYRQVLRIHGRALQELEDLLCGE